MAEARLLEMSEETEQQHRRTSPSHGNANAGLFTRIIRPILAELVGTTMYLLIGLITLSHSRSALAVALTFGMALAAYLACFGHISGGHFNPATTAAVFIAGEVHIVLALMYIVTQLIGGIAAAALARLLAVPGMNAIESATTPTEEIEAAAIAARNILRHGIEHLNTTWWKALSAEALFTMTFVFVILMTTKDRLSKTGLAPFLVGMTMTACMIALASISGGHLNPARSFGCAVVMNNWKYHYIFWAGPLIGSLLAGLMYRFIFSHAHSQFMRKSSG